MTSGEPRSRGSRGAPSGSRAHTPGLSGDGRPCSPHFGPAFGSPFVGPAPAGLAGAAQQAERAGKSTGPTQERVSDLAAFRAALASMDPPETDNALMPAPASAPRGLLPRSDADPSTSAAHSLPSSSRGKAAKAAHADRTLHPVVRLGWKPLCKVYCGDGLTGEFLGGHDRDMYIRCLSPQYAGLPDIDVNQVCVDPSRCHEDLLTGRSRLVGGVTC